MTASAIPGAIDGLLAVFSAVSGVSVIDGKGAARVDDSLQVWVGVDNPSDDDDIPTAARDGQQTWPNLGHLARRETFTIACTAVAWTGDDTPKAMRDVAFALFGALTDAMVADPTLGGAVQQIDSIDDITYRPVSDDDGVAAYVSFGVTCIARL